MAFEGTDSTGYRAEFRLHDESGQRLPGPSGDFAFQNPVLVGGARRASCTLLWAEPAEASRGRSMDERRSWPPESLWSADYIPGSGWREPARLLVGRPRWAREWSDVASTGDAMALVVPLEELPGIAILQRNAGSSWSVHTVQTPYLPRATSVTFTGDGLAIAAAMLEDPTNAEARYAPFVADLTVLQRATRWTEGTPAFRSEAPVRLVKLRATSNGNLTATVATDTGSVEHWIRRASETDFEQQCSTGGDRTILRLAAEADEHGGVWVAYLREPPDGYPHLESFQVRAAAPPGMRTAPPMSGVVDIAMSSGAGGAGVTLVGLRLGQDERGEESAAMILAEAAEGGA